MVVTFATLVGLWPARATTMLSGEGAIDPPRASLAAPPEVHMHWDTYTVFSVLSGATMVLFGHFAPSGTGAKARCWLLLGGGGFVAYGIYVAHQTTGTFFFPAEIFVIPVLVIAYFVISLVGRGAGTSTSVAPRASSPTGSAPNVVLAANRASMAGSSSAPRGVSGSPRLSRLSDGQAAVAVGLRQHAYCEQCGTPLAGSKRFCTGCGCRQAEA